MKPVGVEFYKKAIFRDQDCHGDNFCITWGSDDSRLCQPFGGSFLMSTPIIFFNSLMGIIGGFQVFIQPLIMTNGGPNNGSLFYALYLFREGFQFSRMGSASAMAWALFVLILILSASFYKFSKKWVYYGGE